MLLARVVVATALAVSGVVHLDLAGSYDRIGAEVTVGALFRVQALLALLVAAWLLARRRGRAPLLAAGAVGLASALAVVLSVYVRLPALGPLPELYEPVWYPEKVLSAVVAALVAAGALLLLGRERRHRLP